MQWDPLEESFSLLHWLEPLFAKLVLVHPYGENLLFIIHAHGETVLFVADEAVAGGMPFLRRMNMLTYDTKATSNKRHLLNTVHDIADMSVSTDLSALSWKRH